MDGLEAWVTHCQELSGFLRQFEVDIQKRVPVVSGVRRLLVRLWRKQDCNAHVIINMTKGQLFRPAFQCQL